MSDSRPAMRAGMDSHSDILTLVRTQTEARGGAGAIETAAGDTISYAAMSRLVETVANGLVAAGLCESGRRPRIGMVLPNGPDMAVTLLGVTAAGAALPFNPAYTEAEFVTYFRDTRIDALLVREGETGAAVAAAARQGLRVLELTTEGGIAGTTSAPGFVPPPDPDDVALVLLTSGSTGRAKAVPLTHRNVCASAGDVSRSMDLGAGDRCLAMWEQYHVGGLVDLLLAPLASGGTVICTAGFDVGEFFRLLDAARPSWFQAVPATLNEIVFHAGRHPETAKPHSLRLIRSVAAALPPRLMAELEETFAVPVIQTFGMTEAGPLITSTALPPAVRKPGSVGRSCGAEIRIVGSSGETLAANEQGEVAVRGANVFSGYENDPEANAQQFRAGWFHTGDLGYLDPDGDLFLTGRIKQLINRGGEKVNPQEVEDALLAHPAVAEAAVFPVKHRTLGEDVAAAIVLRAPADPAEIRADLTSRLASFKLPQRIEVLQTLPRTAVGKIDRIALSDQADNKTAERQTYIAPRNELELFLTHLWATELDAGAVGIDDDFAALGGDSLSSLRLILATESALGLSIPDETAADFTTVRRMADRLTELGADVDGKQEAASSQIRRLSDQDLKSLLIRIESGFAGAEDDLHHAYDRLRASSSRKEFKAIADSIVRYSTPAELGDLLERARLRFGSIAEMLRRPLSAVKLGLQGWLWRNELRRELGTHRRASAWEREVVSENAFLYTAPDVAASDKILIVGFSSVALRLMMPTYRILLNLDPARFDLLLLRDPGRKHFADGVSGLGHGLEGMADFLSDFAARKGYALTVAFGTSAGGLASIWTACRNGWARAVAVGPDFPSRQPRIAEYLDQLPASGGRGGLRVHFPGRNVRDAAAAAEIVSRLPSVQPVPHPRFRHHNLLDALYRAGELESFFESEFAAPPS